MSREIKFRFYNPTNNKLIYPDTNMGNFSDLQEGMNWKVMQYTGLKDKNGKDIYEGDIVKTTDNGIFGHITEVFYDAPEFALRDKANRQFTLFRSEEHSGYEVIGNIYKDQRPMNKTTALKELKVWNGVRVINGTWIANVGWFNDPWIIIEPDKSFDEVSDRSYKPIISFHTKKELLDEIFKKVK